jgi:hypothetical protein
MHEKKYSYVTSYLHNKYFLQKITAKHYGIHYLVLKKRIQGISVTKFPEIPRKFPEVFDRFRIPTETALIIFDLFSRKYFRIRFRFEQFQPIDSVFENMPGIRKVSVPFSPLPTGLLKTYKSQKKPISFNQCHEKPAKTN